MTWTGVAAQQASGPIDVDQRAGEMRLGAFGEILQLADVAAPGLRHQQRHGAIIEGTTAGVESAEMRHQRRDILGPVGERRHDDADDIEAIKQIAAKGAAIDGGEQIHAGRGEQTDVDSDRQHAAHPFDDAGFQRTQQLGLHGERHVADFVEEQPTPIRLTHTPTRCRVRPIARI